MAQIVPAGELMPTTGATAWGGERPFYKVGVGVLGGPSLISADPADSGQYKCCSQAPNGTGAELQKL
jgi:hypothetical protein